MKSRKPILLVEDDRIDALTIRRAFRETGVSNSLIIMEHGERALEYLHGPANDMPALILLDLNMPCMNGIEFMRHIKADAGLASIPVIVFTTSRQEREKQQCYALGAAGYMIKPVDYNDFLAMIRAIDQYWSCCELPGED